MNIKKEFALIMGVVAIVGLLASCVQPTGKTDAGSGSLVGIVMPNNLGRWVNNSGFMSSVY